MPYSWDHATNSRRVDAILQPVTAFHERSKVVASLRNALNDEERTPLTKLIQQKLDWLWSKMNEVLDRDRDVPGCPDLGPEDARALVKLLYNPTLQKR